MTASNHPRPVDLLVQGGTVVCVDDAFTVLEDGAVAVDGTDIVAVGPSAKLREQFAPRRVLDASHHAVLPGLVNGHTHVAMTLFRGMADDLALETWLNDHIWPAEAAFVDRDSVGRHNATDKVIGALLRAGGLPPPVLLVSGRLGFEIAQKAAFAGIRMVAAISAPTSLAVDLADEAGLTLVGFLRGETFNVYTHPGRIG